MARWTPPQASIQVKTEENEMEQSVEKIIERNLLEVFNARDADSRRAAIDELWDKYGVFIDPGGVHEGVEKINAIVQLLFTQFEDYVFSVRGPGQSMHGVGRLPWMQTIRPLSGCVTSTSSALRVLVTREGLRWHHTTATLTL